MQRAYVFNKNNNKSNELYRSVANKSKDQSVIVEYLAIIIITTISGVVGTGLGGVIGAVLKRDSNKVVSLLLSFAAGVMLAVVSFDLMREPIDMMNEGVLPSYTPVLVVLAVAV